MLGACTPDPMPAPKPEPIVLQKPEPEKKPRVRPARTVVKFDVGGVPQVTDDPKAKAAIEAHLAEPANTARLFVPDAVRRFYAQRDHQPAWTWQGHLNGNAVQVLRALRQLRRHGLDPSHYGLDVLDAAEADPEDPAALDLALTDRWLLVSSHLAEGRLDAKTLKPRVQKLAIDDALIEALEASIIEGKAHEAMGGHAPSHAEYTGLQSALAALRKELAATEPAAQKPVQARIDRVTAALEQWRTRPHDLGARYLLVDPEMNGVVFVDAKKPAVRSAMTASSACRATPEWSGTFGRVTLNPSGQSGLSLSPDGDAPAISVHSPHPEGTPTPTPACFQLDDPVASLAKAMAAGHPKWTDPKVDLALAADKPVTLELVSPTTLLVVHRSVYVDAKGQLQLGPTPTARERAVSAALARSPARRRKR